MGRRKELGVVVKRKKDTSRKREKIIYYGSRQYTAMIKKGIDHALEKAKEELRNSGNDQPASSKVTKATTTCSKNNELYKDNEESSHLNELWVDWYMAGADVEESQATLTTSEINCHCTKLTKQVTLYMLNGTVDQEITYCRCTPLVKVLLSMQFMPSETLFPDMAVHFTALKFLHALKSTCPVSFVGFAKALTSVNNKGKPLLRPDLYNCYNIYRDVIQHAATTTNKKV